MPNISIVIPVYNEAAGLAELLREVEAAAAPYDHEILFVDDGSTDGSAAILKEARERNRRIKIIQFADNFGQHAALMAGYLAAKGEIIVTLDADLQNDPAVIPLFIDKIEKEGNDAAFGWRQNRENSLWLRQLPSRLLNRARNRYLQKPLHDYGCALNAFRRHFIDELRDSPDHLKHITTHIASRRVKYEEVRIEERERHAGRSHYNFARLLQLAMDLLITTSNRPIATVVMLYAAATSAVLCAVSLGMALWGVYTRGADAALWLLLPYFFLTAALICGMLALLNEKVSSLLRLSRKKPSYIIKEQLD